MTPQWLIVCAGLTAGTYLVRVLPFWFPWIDSLPVPVKRFLDAVPAAALGALLFPDALIGTPAIVAIIVVMGAFYLTIRGVSITVVVLVTIGFAWTALSML